MNNKKRFIDANSLIEDLSDDLNQDCNRYMYWYQKEERDAKYTFAIDRVQEAPTVDAVEVVRCKDCPKWFLDCTCHSYIDGELHQMGLCKHTRRYTADCDFCSYGERI